MDTQTVTNDAQHQIECNKETIEFWREEAGLYYGLALNVDSKVDAGKTLSPLEQRILNTCLTQDHIDLVKEHLWFL